MERFAETILSIACTAERFPLDRTDQLPPRPSDYDEFLPECLMVP